MAAIDANTTAWLDAIRGASYGSARQHLRHDQDVNVRGVGGQTALHVVAKVGHLRKVQKLIRDRADAFAIDDQGNTPLMVAQCHERPQVVSFLIQHTQLVRALTSHLGHKPTANQIHSAMFQSKWQALRDQMHQRLEQDTAKLLQASRTGDLSAVRRLVEDDQAYVNAVDPSTNETAFSVALAGGWHFVCDYLLANGAHAYGFCVVDGKIQSTLMAAVMQGNVSFVRRLLSHCVHLWSPRYDRTTCVLTQAVHSGSSEMVDVLLEAGAQFERRGDLPKSVYHALCTPWPGIPSREYKIPQISQKEKPIWQRLFIACWQQDMIRINELFATYTELQDREMMAQKAANALFLATYHENLEIVMELLARGANINSTDGFGLTAMLAAVLVDSCDMLQFLLERGGDVSVMHHVIDTGLGDDMSLLSTAIYAGSVDCAYFLLPMESRPRQRDEAMNFAIERDDEQFVRALLDEALPSNEQAFRLCVRLSRSPTMLDLLLTKCCAERYPITSLTGAFCWCCRRAKVSLLEVYIAHGVDASVQVGPETALMQAVGDTTDGGTPDVVEWLLDAGVDASAEDENGRTALDIVEWNFDNRALTPEARSRFEASRNILRGHLMMSKM